MTRLQRWGVRLAAVAGAAWGASRLRRASLRGMTVLITGGSRGLGLELARLLAKEGARLALCARDEAELAAAQRELRSLGGDVLLVPCDVSKPDQAELAVQATAARFGRIDVLVNCAGIIQVGPEEALSLQDYRQAMDINFFGAVHFCRAVLPAMRARGEGRIVNVASIGGAVAVPHLLPYSAAKFALVGYSTGLRAEVAKDGVKVTTILPGLMRTGSFVQALFKGQRDEEEQWFSLGASLPVASISATRAARRILSACQRGEGYVTLGLPAKALRLLAALLPTATAGAMALANRLLPAAGDASPNEPAEPGHLHRALELRRLTQLGQAAALRNNELLPNH